MGGGMAGVMAALAAKTPHNRVLIIEPSNVLGGQGTAGGVAGFCGDTARVNAPFAALVARLTDHNFIAPYRPNDDRRGYDLEWCAFFLQEMVAAQKIDVLLHARVVAAQTNEQRVTELTVSTVGGLLKIGAKFVIDASGACTVACLSGFAVMHEGANRQLPMSLYFTLWDTRRTVRPILPAGCPQWRHDNEIPMTSLHFFPSGKVEVKMKVVGFDAADGFSRSAAEVFARRQMHGLIYYLQTIGYRGRKLDTYALAGVSRGIGVREERRIVGEHILSEEEARRAVIFPDAVAVNTYHIDYHWPDKMERAGTGVTDMLDPHHLPLRMMIPRGARNLLVPGRGASGDQTAMSAFRVMAVVAQMGFAAGHAARQCVETGTDLTSLDVRRLQATIEAGGQSLDLSNYGEYLRRDLFAHETVWPQNSEGPWRIDCAAPALVQLRNGKFLVAWRAGAGGECAIWVATRSERAWSVPRRVTSAHATAQPTLRRCDDEVILSTGGAPARTFHSHDEGQTWSAAVAPNTTAPYAGEFRLKDGARVRITQPENERGRAVALAVSTDEGQTWSPAREIEDEAGESADPAALATTLGLALVYVWNNRRLWFWHGSIERIVDGPPTVQAHALQA